MTFLIVYIGLGIVVSALVTDEDIISKDLPMPAKAILITLLWPVIAVAVLMTLKRINKK